MCSIPNNVNKIYYYKDNLIIITGVQARARA
nr:MAG TPA: hypothetical protein [Caudoviricetes sp.]